MNIENRDLSVLSIYEKKYLEILIVRDTLQSFSEVEGIFLNRRIDQTTVNDLFRLSVLSNNFHVAEKLLNSTSMYLPGLITEIGYRSNHKEYSRVSNMLLQKIRKDLDEISHIIQIHSSL